MFRRLALKTMAIFMALAPISSTYAYSDIQPMRDWVPWPFGQELAFPWDDIQGLWLAEGEGFAAYFSLRVTVEKEAGVRILKIKQLDAATCKTVATGVGIEQDSVVRAQMTAREGRTFRVSFRAFDPDVSPEPMLPGAFRKHNNVMVLSVSSFDGYESRLNTQSEYVQISKKSKGLTMKECISAVENDKK